jgi:heme o synthase
MMLMSAIWKKQMRNQMLSGIMNQKSGSILSVELNRSRQKDAMPSTLLPQGLLRFSLQQLVKTFALDQVSPVCSFARLPGHPGHPHFHSIEPTPPKGGVEMATESTIAAVSMAAQLHLRKRSILRVVADYWTLTKPHVNLLIVISVRAGFFLAKRTPWASFPFALLISTLFGSLLVAGGTGALNQVIERKFDAQMRRTSHRPLVAGHISPHSALWFGISLSFCGAVYLALAVNWLSSLIAVLILVSYLAIYTPLKRKTWYCTLIGALPGAAPPLIGWVAASGTLSPGAWMLYAMVFLWQFPHFMAIAWMYRDDYDRAGYMVLPRGRGRSRLMTWQTMLPACLLIPLTLIPVMLGKAGLFYASGALFLGVGFLYTGLLLVLRKSNTAARHLLTASIIYLPSVFLLMWLGEH